MNDGGPAFPSETYEGLIDSVNGMSLRDYFAAKAMQGIVSSCNDKENLTPSENAHLIAIASYLMADAMLKAREAK